MSRYRKIIWILFFAVLAVRLWLAFSTPHFEYDSYFHIRQIENIAETGLPAFNDNLSYGGGFFVFSPLFHYIMAGLSFLIPLGIIGKILPSVLYSLMIPLGYYIAREITGDRRISLIAPAVIAFMPVMWSNILSLNPLCMALPAIFYALYCLIKKQGKEKIIHFLIFMTLAALLSPIALLAIPVLWLYILFLKIEKIREKGPLLELVTFSTFFILLLQFLFYKKAILVNGFGIIWQNIPSSILENYFSSAGILDIIANIGILPFIFGLYEIYVFSFEKKERASSLFISLTIVMGIVLWAKLLPLEMGMLLLGIGISIISVPAVKYMINYLKKIRFRNVNYVMTGIIIIFIITAVIPAFYYYQLSTENVPDRSEQRAMLWLNENSTPRSVIVGDVNDGFFISAVAERRNIIDANFLMKRDAEERLQDITTIYSTKYETAALDLLNKYSAKYIFFGKNVKERFNVTALGFEDKECFDDVFKEENITIYKTWCDLE